MLNSATAHFTRSGLVRVFVLVAALALLSGGAASATAAPASSAAPNVYVSSPTIPLIEWTAEDTLFRPRFPAGAELDGDLEREREEAREREQDREENPEREAAERRAEQASGMLSTIESITMLEDASLNGFYFIPADPSGAVGPNHVLSVVNSAIRWHTTAGVAQNSQRLGMNSSGSIVGSFFEPLSPINSLYDPKAYYDTQAGRFLVVVLEKGNSPTTSRILLAVSDDSDPNGTWYYLSINSKVNIGGNDCWADYPSIGVDEQAVYITNNMFTWPGAWGGNRLWIVDKTAFYSGGAASATIYDPWALAGASGFATTCMVASVFGTPPAGNTGTWLLSYSGLTDGTNEYIGFLRVDNPIASPTFTYTQVNCGNVDNTSLAMPKSSQPGTAVQLEMNDNRALAACYRNNKLYLCAQVVPPSGADAGQATVHWWKFDATTPAAIALNDHGNVGGEEMGSGTNTSFPSIAVDAADDIAVGFSASGASVYPGSYYAVHAAGDPAGSMQAPVVVAPGVDFYYRAFGGARNRWGDYTVTAIDPTGSTFWTYNKYALSRGSVLGSYPSEDGRWGTRWANFTVSGGSSTLAATLTAPNGGESWGFGSAHNITWTASGGTAPITVDLDYSTNGGGAWTSITTGLANSGSYSWSVPAVATANARVRLTAHDAAAGSASDASNADFTLADLTAPVMALSAPLGGESWVAGSGHNITWTASDNVGVTSVTLELSTNNGGAWSNISVGETNDGTYAWSVPAVATAQAKVRATAFDLAGNSMTSTSAAFAITVPDNTPPVVTLTAPNGGGTLAMGAATSITWTASDNVGVTGVSLYYSTDNGGSYTPIVTNVPNSGSRAWTVPNVATAQALVRVVAADLAANTAQDESDAPFAIADQTLPAVSLTAPAAGATWQATTSHAITWTASDNVGVTWVGLEISTDNGGSYAPIASALSNSGSYSWSVPATPTATAKMRITVKDAAANVKAATSGAFNITSGPDVTPPVVTVLSPNGGESWGIGTAHAITWSATDNIGVTAVAIDYSANNGGSWTPVAAGLVNSGSYAWTTPAAPTAQGRVRVTASDAAANATADQSDAAFGLADLTAPVVSVSAPAGGSNWIAGSVHTLNWTATDNVAVTAVDLDYSTNGGGGWTSISTGEANDGAYAWTVPNTLTNQAIVRATAHDAAANSGSGQSGTFTIAAPADATPPAVTVTAPNGGESWGLGTGHAITWTATDNVGVTSVKVEYSANGGAGWSTLASGLANSGSYSWTTPGAPTVQGRVRVTAADAAANSGSDVSDANFALVDQTPPVVTVSAPAPGNSWTVGSSHPVLWNATDNVGVTAIDLDYSTNGGGTWTAITTGETNDGAYTWLVPNDVSAQARVRVTARDAAANSGSGQSAQFTIGAAPDLTPPTITLTAPNGGEVLAMGAGVNVTWSAADNVGVTGINVEYSATGGAGWSVLATGEANDGAWTWTVPTAATLHGLFRVTAFDGNGNSTSDASNAQFEVRDQTAPAITLTNPATPVVWTPGNPVVIIWTATDNVGVTGVDIDFSRDGGVSWQAVAAGEANDGSYPWTVADLNTTTGILRLTAHDAAGNSGMSQTGDIVVQPIVPVTLVSFLAARDADGVALSWEVTEADQRALFQVDRQDWDSAERVRLTDRPLTGQLRYAFHDDDPPAAGADYWLEELDPQGRTNWYGPVTIAELGAASVLNLLPARPNPFRLQTSVTYTLPVPADVRLTVHDVQGRAVAQLIDRNEAAGTHVAAWDGTDATARPVAPGIYFMSLEAGGRSITRKVVRVH